MRSLNQVQLKFKQYVQGCSMDIVPMIEQTGSGPQSRLNIYQNAYHLRLLEALQSDFPAVQAICGEQWFTQLAYAYIEAFPSKYFSLRDFGTHMEEFLRNLSSTDAAPALAEMAHFEWLLLQAFDCKDSPTVSTHTVQSLAEHRWPELTMSVHPSVSLTRFHWNTLENWQRQKKSLQTVAIEKLNQRVYCLIWRQNFTTRYRTLDHIEANALQIVQQGGTMTELCSFLERHAPKTDHTALHAARYFKNWVDAHMIAELH